MPASITRTETFAYGNDPVRPTSIDAPDMVVRRYPRPVRVRTAIDDEKDAAQILLQSCDSGSYTIKSRISLEGRGITRYDNGCYSVTKRVWNKMKDQYTWTCDF